MFKIPLPISGNVCIPKLLQRLVLSDGVEGVLYLGPGHRNGHDFLRGREGKIIKPTKFLDTQAVAWPFTFS